MVPDTIRSEVDRHLSVQLLQDQHIQRIQAAMEEHQSSQTRRSLLARRLFHLRNVKSWIIVVQYSMLKLKLSCMFTVEVK